MSRPPPLQDLLRKLADADHLGVVRQVQEFYADFFAVNPDTFTLNLGGTLALSRPKASYTHADETALKRCTAGLLALLLSFKVRRVVCVLEEISSDSSRTGGPPSHAPVWVE